MSGWYLYEKKDNSFEKRSKIDELVDGCDNTTGISLSIEDKFDFVRPVP